MPRCTICNSTARTDIEKSVAAGMSYRLIASQHNVGYKSIMRHVADGHIADSIKASQQAIETVRGMDVAREMDWSNARAHQIHDLAMKGKKPDLRVALSAVNAVTRQSELYAEIKGELNRGVTIDIHQDPQWINLRELIFKTLEPFPEARIAIAKAIHEEAQRGRSIA